MNRIPKFVEIPQLLEKYLEMSVQYIISTSPQFSWSKLQLSWNSSVAMKKDKEISHLLSKFSYAHFWKMCEDYCLNVSPVSA